MELSFQMVAKRLLKRQEFGPGFVFFLIYCYCFTMSKSLLGVDFMIKKFIFGVFFALCQVAGFLTASPELMPMGSVTDADRAVRKEIIDSLRGRICQYTLANGMTVICIPATNTNSVTVGAFVRVGSIHEAPNQWGLAHILEHMVFKETKNRREGDINRLAEHFGCNFNAHTTFDHTYYYFNTDDKNWRVFADVVADATQNLIVTPQALSSELATICQEIKQRGLDLDGLSLDKFVPMNHPYAHSLIGYKEQVLSYTAPEVMAFYEQHYVPQRTTFFVCGNVNPSDVIDYAQKAFAGFTRTADALNADSLKSNPFYAGFSVTHKTVYHTQQYRIGNCVWQTPGSGQPEWLVFYYIVNALNVRMKNKLVNQLGYCFNAGASLVSLPSFGMLSVHYVPRPDFYSIDFDALIADELADIAQNGLSEPEFFMMYHGQTAQLVECAEDPTALVSALAALPQVTEDITSQFFALQEALLQVRQDMVRHAAAQYLRPFCMNKLEVLPLPTEEMNAWNVLQVKTSLHESALLQSRQRSDNPPSFSKNDTSWLPARIALDPISVGTHETFTLPNGIQVYWQRDATSPRRVCSLVLKDIESLILAYKASGKAFAWEITPTLLLQGTEQYSAKELTDAFLKHGASLVISPGVVKASALKNHFEEGIQLMRHVLEKACLSDAMLARYKEEQVQGIALNQNSPSQCLEEYLTKTLYAAYPWRFSREQVISNLQAVTRDDIVQLVALMRDPSRIGLVMCGDFDKEEAYSIAQRHFGSWNQAAECTISPVTIPELAVQAASGHIELPLEHSQIMFLRPSCPHVSPDAAPVALLGLYLNRLLFDLRERSGVFYAGGAKASVGSKLLPGLIYFVVNATAENTPMIIGEVQKIIQNLFENGISESVFLELRGERAHTRGTYFNTADTVAQVFTRALYDGLALNFDELFDKQVDAVTLDQVNSVARKYFDPAAWSCITIGRSH